MGSRPTPSLLTCPQSPPTIPYRGGRLLVGCVPPSSASHLNPRTRPYHYFDYFRHSIRRPKRWINVLTARSGPVASALNRPAHHQHYRSFGCRFLPSIGGHLRLVLRPSLNFLWVAFRCPKKPPQHEIKRKKRTQHQP